MGTLITGLDIICTSDLLLPILVFLFLPIPFDWGCIYFFLVSYKMTFRLHNYILCSVFWVSSDFLVVGVSKHKSIIGWEIR